MKDKILVTGGAGFIGSHLVDGLIDKGFNVFIIDNLSTGKKENLNKKAKFIFCDIRDSDKLFKAFEEVKPDYVYHLAAQPSVPVSIQKPIYDVEVNIVGGLNVLEAAMKSNTKKFIFASTGGAIYGEVPERVKAKETWQLKPESIYGASKAYFENCLKIIAEGKIKYVILRFANVYGPRQDPYGEAGVVAIFCNSLINGNPIKIFAKKRKGDNGCIRDYIYVEDVVSACLLSLKIKDGIYNVGTGKGRETIEVYKEIAKNAGSNSKIIFEGKRIGDLERNVLNCKKLKDNKWNPKFDFCKEIKKTYYWFKKNNEKKNN